MSNSQYGKILCDGECGRRAKHIHKRDYTYYECNECYLIPDNVFFKKRRRRLERKEAKHKDMRKEDKD